MRRIFRVFTRDFDQCLLETIRTLLVNDCKALWGRSISDQIIHFNGRSGEWWRYEDDMKSLKARFCAMYPLYPVALFVPGPWRQDFIAAHTNDPEGTNAVLARLEHSRHESEGGVKETGLYLRRWLEPLLEGKGYPKEFVRLLTLAEVESFVKDGTLPRQDVLDARSRGFVHYQGRLECTTDFDGFLKCHGLQIAEEKATHAELRGTVASIGPVLRGRVQVVMNSYEADKFQAGSILVTPMTSPEYLPAMKTAIGIVTDEGGLTCHAAIVSRELGVPCVIGTKVATSVLKDGDEVEMDATHGMVRKI